jgi:hypothetical protein
VDEDPGIEKSGGESGVVRRYVEHRYSLGLDATRYSKLKAQSSVGRVDVRLALVNSLGVTLNLNLDPSLPWHMNRNHMRSSPV